MMMGEMRYKLLEMLRFVSEQTIITVAVRPLPQRAREPERPRQPTRGLVVEEGMAVHSIPILRIDSVSRFERRRRLRAEREVEIDNVVARIQLDLQQDQYPFRHDEKGKLTYRSFSSRFFSFIPDGTTSVANPNNPFPSPSSSCVHNLGKIPLNSLCKNPTLT